MKKTQPIRNLNKKIVVNSIEKKIIEKDNNKKNKNTNETPLKYGISKLEAYFAENFLDKLGLKYIYEYEAKDVGRFFDFAITSYTEVPFIMENKHGVNSIKQENQNVPIAFIVEVDGDYYHSNPKLFNENKLNNLQKKNKYNDFLKNRWCDLHCIPLLRIWENDIRKNPNKVFEILNEQIKKSHVPLIKKINPRN